MTDTGIVCRGKYNGREVLGIRLNWHKRYITLAPVATVIGLAFKLHDPDGLLGGQEDIGITVALVPTDTPGVETGRRHLPCLQMFQNGPTTGKDVFIPLDYVIGGPGTRRPGLGHADDRPGGGARHLAAIAGRGGNIVRRAYHGRLCPHPRAVRHSDRQVRGGPGTPGPARRPPIWSRRPAASPAPASTAEPSRRSSRAS
jgi:hypothetical protein